MDAPRRGDPAPDFTAEDQSGRRHTLADYRGRRFVLYFYPKDQTFYCTREACSFQENLAEFEGLGVPVLGVSHDTTASHARFAAAHGLRFPLLADPARAIIRAYGADGLLGRTKRLTFIIGTDGRIEAVHHRELSGKGHVAWARETLRRLAAAPAGTAP